MIMLLGVITLAIFELANGAQNVFNNGKFDTASIVFFDKNHHEYIASFKYKNAHIDYLIVCYSSTYLDWYESGAYCQS